MKKKTYAKRILLPSAILSFDGPSPRSQQFNHIARCFLYDNLKTI